MHKFFLYISLTAIPIICGQEIHKERIMLHNVTQDDAKIQQQIINFEMNFRNTVEKLSRHIDMLHANQMNMRKSLYADWTYLPGFNISIKLFPSAMKYADAKSTCEFFAADLLKIESEEMNTLITGIIKNSIDHSLWIGSRIRFHPSDMNGYENYDVKSSTEGCVAMTKNGFWLHRPCDQERPFLCVSKVQEFRSLETLRNAT